MTQLRVGTKSFKSKPPRGKGPCSESRILRPNVLLDPGFESGGDKLGTRVPMQDNTPELFYPDIQYDDETGIPAAPTEGYTPTLGWTADFDLHTTGRYYEYATAAPYSGTYHMQSNTYGENINFDNLWAVGGKMCISGHAQGWYSAIVQSGDVIVWSLFSRRTGTSGTLENGWRLLFLDSTGASVFSDTGSWILDLHISAYQAYTHNIVAPANAHYLQAAVETNTFGTPSSDTRVYHDEVVLGIT